MAVQILAVVLIVAAVGTMLILGFRAQQEVASARLAKRARQSLAEQAFVEAVEAGDFHEAERQLRHRFSLEGKGASQNRSDASGQDPPERRYGRYGLYGPFPPWPL